MEIGGQDFWIEGHFEDSSIPSILRWIASRWPEAVVELSDGTDLGIQSVIQNPLALPCELFIYRDTEALESWNELGATSDNAELLLSCSITSNYISLVCDGVTVEMGKELLLALAAH